MEYDLKIRQSYHDTGTKPGYRFKLYNNLDEKLGELIDVPVELSIGHTVCIGGNMFIVTDIYDSSNPKDERSEVIFYELAQHNFQPDFNLGEIIK